MTIFISSRKRYARHIVWIATIAMLAASVEAWGQTSKATQWQRGTTLGGFAGVASLESTMPALGTALGWEINRHVTVEGRGIWMTKDPGGTDVFVTSHIAIRPEVSLVLVMNGGDTRTVGLYGVHVAYHFEPHKMP